MPQLDNYFMVFQSKFQRHTLNGVPDKHTNKYTNIHTHIQTAKTLRKPDFSSIDVLRFYDLFGSKVVGFQLISSENHRSLKKSSVQLI